MDSPQRKSLHDKALIAMYFKCVRMVARQRLNTMRLAAATVLILSSVAWSQTASKRLITETDIYDFQWIADPQISPDGSQVAYIHVKVNAKRDGYDTSVWAITTSGGTPRQLTAGPRDASPR